MDRELLASELLRIAKVLTASRFMRQVEDYILDNADEADLMAIEMMVKIKRERLKHVR